MPTETKRAIAAAAALPTIPMELIDQFGTGPISAEAVNAASMAFKKALIERAALGAELTPTWATQGDAGPDASATTATAPVSSRSSATSVASAPARAAAR